MQPPFSGLAWALGTELRNYGIFVSVYSILVCDSFLPVAINFLLETVNNNNIPFFLLISWAFKL